MIRRLWNVLSILLVWLAANGCALDRVGDHPPVGKGEVRDTQNIRILIAYQSKYGSTRQYAEWIREACSGDLVNAEEELPDMSGYDILIIGSSVRIGKIVIAPFIQGQWDAMKGKKVILFTTSGTPPSHPRIREIYEKSLPEEIRKEIRYFPLHGRISREQLTLWDKFLMAVGKIMERDEALKKDMGKDFDGVQRESLSPLLEYLSEVKTHLGMKKQR